MKFLTLLACFAGLCRALAAPEMLLPGDSMSAWRDSRGWMTACRVALVQTGGQQFVIAPGAGILVNGEQGRAADLVSREVFGDAQFHVEFCIPRHSNSGVYLMGRYEVQIYDSFGVVKDKYPGLECGGIYPRYDSQRHEYEGHSPAENVSRPPGLWQCFDITFQAPRFDAHGRKTENARILKVIHNGRLVQENVELTGPTHGGYEGEKPAGPLRLQGDHGPVAYRNLRITPL